jgi:hypothetical protein
MEPRDLANNGKLKFPLEFLYIFPLRATQVVAWDENLIRQG